MDELFRPRTVHQANPAKAFKETMSIVEALGMAPGETEVTVKVTLHHGDEEGDDVTYYPDHATWERVRPYLARVCPSFDVEDVHGVLTLRGFEPR